VSHEGLDVLNAGGGGVGAGGGVVVVEVGWSRNRGRELTSGYEDMGGGVAVGMRTVSLLGETWQSEYLLSGLGDMGYMVFSGFD